MTDPAPVMRRTALPPPPPPPADMLARIEALLDQRPVDPSLETAAERERRTARQRAEDWPGLSRYRAANAGIDRPDLVMIGDSLTEIWGLAMPDMFGAKVVNRGIAGQTSPQILLRFVADVVELRPARVHILCGTNDIAGNTGPNVPEDFQRNIRAMVDLATANGIAVLLASLPPAGAIIWQPEACPRAFVPQLNRWLRAFAAERGLVYLDYHAALTDGADALQQQYSADGVHVTRAAYRVMRHILGAALPDRRWS